MSVEDWKIVKKEARRVLILANKGRRRLQINGGRSFGLLRQIGEIEEYKVIEKLSELLLKCPLFDKN